MNRLIPIYLFTLLLVGGCATNMLAGSHCSNDEQAFANNYTYQWHSARDVKLIDESGYISPAILEQLRKRVELEMANKGYKLMDDESDGAPADLVLQLYVQARRELRDSGAYGELVGPCSYPSCWQASHNPSLRMHVQTIGFVAADIYQGDKAIWRGWVERTLHPTERDKALPLIESAVTLLFAKLPAAN